jgi:hypothetical protein
MLLLQGRLDYRRKRVAAVAGRIAHMQDYIGDGVIVRLAECGRHLEQPGADGAGAFEREVSVVAEVELEESAVVLGCASCDRVDGTDVVGEARVVG